MTATICAPSELDPAVALRILIHRHGRPGAARRYLGVSQQAMARLVGGAPRMLATYRRRLNIAANLEPGVVVRMDTSGAHCVGVSTCDFVADDTTTRRRAAKICGGCPLSDTCLAVALSIPDTVGVWGGEDFLP